MNTLLIPFSIQHVLMMELREHEKQCMNVHHEYLDGLVSMARGGYAVTVVADSQPMASFGVAPYWDGVLEIWAVTSVLADKYPIAFHKAALGFIESVDKIYKPHRIQAGIDIGWPQNIRWIERLGFKNEGLMEKYSIDKRDYARYARITGGG